MNAYYDKVNEECYTWEEGLPYQTKVMNVAILQFNNLYNKYKDKYLEVKDLKWGEEVEYHVCTLDHENKVARIDLEGYTKVEELVKAEDCHDFILEDEYGSWMIEAIPKKPFMKYAIDGPLQALKSLIRRRKKINQLLEGTGDFIVSL